MSTPTTPLTRSSSCTHLILPNIAKHTGEYFNLKCNPFHQEGETASCAWFDSHKILAGAQRETFFNHRFNLLISYCYPDADLNHLVPAMKFMLWVFPFDDMADLGEFKSEGLKLAVHAVMNVLRNPDDVQSQPKVATPLHDSFNSMRRNGSPTAIRHFVEATESYIGMVIKDMDDHNVGHIPTFEKYREYRADTSGVKVTLAMLEYAHEIYIPDEVLHHPVISDLSLAGNKIIAWANDICSFPKEYASGCTHNLVFVIIRHNQLEPQDAVNYVNELIEQRVQDYLTARALLPSFGPDSDHQVTRYIQGIEHCIQACNDWTYMTTRYFGAGAAKLKEDGVVELVC